MNRHGLRRVIHSYRAARARGTECVLATVIGTRGSSYRKAGARMLIETNGAKASVTGIVGGGCFDDDLMAHARRVARSGQPGIQVYDMSTDDDVLWGLGMGCNGVVEVLLQPLDLAASSNAMDLLQTLIPGGGRLATTLVAGTHPAGHSWILSPDEFEGINEPTTLADNSTFIDCIAPRFALGIFGAGSDVLPLVDLADQLDWEVHIWDHRPAYARAERFPAAAHVATFTGAVPATAAACQALLVMSHNFDADRRFLAAVARLRPDYIGVLGPASRRQRLLQVLGDAAANLQLRLRGPVGLDLGGELPEEIALSAVAQIHSLRTGRSATDLDS